MNRMKAYLRRHHLAMLALFIALGGTSYAAASLPRNSVGANQIRTGAVTHSEIATGAVRSTEVRDGSLLAKDFKSGQVPRGATGATGPQGPAGATGPAGPAAPASSDPLPAVRVRQSTDTQAVPSSAGSATTPVLFTDPNSEQYDIGGFFDPAAATTPPEPPGTGVLTIPRTGTYIVTAGVRWASNPTGARSLFLSGPQPGGVRASSTVPANAGDVTRQTLATTERFSAGDRILISVSQSSGDPLLLDASQNQIHLSAAFIGP